MKDMKNKKIYPLICCLQRQLHRNNNGIFSEYGVTPVQMHALMFVYKNNKLGADICQRDIESELNLRPSSVSTLITNLEKNGLIARSVSEGDARAKSISLTERGNIVCIENKMEMDKCDSALQEILSEEEQDILKNLLLKVLGSIK